MQVSKHRLRFEKSGALRFLSHLDLIRSVERLCRRAEIPFASTQGFHPSPRIAYPLALPLGIVGLNEILEIELRESLDANAVLQKLNTCAPAGLRFLSAYEIEPTVTAMVRRAIYRLELCADDVEVVSRNLPSLLSRNKIWTTRLKPHPRQINIRPYIRAMAAESSSLILDFWVTPYGTARADEVIALLGLPSPFETGRMLERTEVELHDEVYDGLPDAPPEGLPERASWNPSSDVWSDEPKYAAATWGLSPNGPVIE